MLKISTSHTNFPLAGNHGENLLWILSLLFPVLVHIKHGVSVVFGLMVLLSLYLLIRSRRNLKPVAIYMLAALVVFIFVSLLSFYNAEDMENSIRRIGKLVNFVYLIPVFVAMAWSKTNLVKAFLIGAWVGGFVLLAIALYQVYILGYYSRAVGFYNSIMFGSIAVVITLALFVSLLFIKLEKIHYAAILLSLLSALIATILSETRGAWLGLIFAAPLALGLAFKVKQIPTKNIVLVLIVGIVLTSIATLLARDAFVERWQATSQSMDVSEALRDEHSSVGLRLIMWDAAIKIWYRNPVVGTGLGDFSVDFENMVNSGEAGYPGMEIAAFSYAHSTFFEALAGTGILGLIGLILATILLPVVFFSLALKGSRNEYDRYAAVFGLVFITAFMIFGLTENWLAHKQLVMTFSLLLAIMASRYGSRAE